MFVDWENSGPCACSRVLCPRSISKIKLSGSMISALRKRFYLVNFKSLWLVIATSGTRSRRSASRIPPGWSVLLCMLSALISGFDFVLFCFDISRCYQLFQRDFTFLGKKMLKIILTALSEYTYESHSTHLFIFLGLRGWNPTKDGGEGIAQKRRTRRRDLWATCLWADAAPPPRPPVSPAPLGRGSVEKEARMFGPPCISMTWYQPQQFLRCQATHLKTDF